jgi:hypothetical protein
MAGMEELGCKACPPGGRAVIKRVQVERWWLTLVILATQEAEIRRIMV